MRRVECAHIKFLLWFKWTVQFEPCYNSGWKTKERRWKEEKRIKSHEKRKNFYSAVFVNAVCRLRWTFWCVGVCQMLFICVCMCIVHVLMVSYKNSWRILIVLRPFNLQSELNSTSSFVAATFLLIVHILFDVSCAQLTFKRPSTLYDSILLLLYLPYQRNH